MAQNKDKKSTFKKKYNGPGITWLNLRDAIYNMESYRIPHVVFLMYNEACKRGGLVKKRLFEDMVYRIIREQLGEEEYNAMLDFLDKYDPPCKTPESKEYWLKKIFEEKDRG